MWELVKTTCLLYKGQEFSSKWFSEADLELHFSGLDLNIRLVVCMAACLWRRRSVTEQYYCKFLKTGRDLNDIWNDIWTTSERHPNSSQVIIDPFDPSCYPFLALDLKEKKREGKNTCHLHCWHSESIPLVKIFKELIWRYCTPFRTIFSGNCPSHSRIIWTYLTL